MNIAIFSPSRNPYSETFIQAHKKYLKDNVFYYYGNGQSIKLEHEVNLISSLWKLLLRIEKKILGKPSHYLWSKPILKSLKRHNINSVLVEYGTHAYSLLPVLSRLKIPVVVHFHGYDASMTEAIESCDYYTDVFKMATYVVAVSKIMEKKLLDIGCPKEKMIYNVYGPRPEFFEVSPTYSKKTFIAIILVVVSGITTGIIVER